MFSKCSTIASVSSNPCATRNDNDHRSKSNYYQSSTCYRPLQLLYKTIYSPNQGIQSSAFNRTCICRPSERYTTTNMTYGSFHYNNWSFIQKNRRSNRDEKGEKNPCRTNGMEGQRWFQETSDACCPTDPCLGNSMLIE